MSEKPQQELSDVSRETSEEKNSNAEKPEPSPSAKTKLPSVYVYLAVLFGAAFLMLLLAYFVQQRNNEAAISSLQSTMNLSREELMEEVHTLEKEKQALLEKTNDLQFQLEQLRSDLNAANANLSSLSSGYFKYVDFTSILQALYTSEVKLESGDYEGAAKELTDIEYGCFVSTIDLFDAETEQYNPYYPDKGMLLRPRLDELVFVLTEQGALAEDWAQGQQP